MYGLTPFEESAANESLSGREAAWDKVLGLMSDINVRKHGWDKYDKLKVTLKLLQDGLPGYEDC